MKAKGKEPHARAKALGSVARMWLRAVLLGVCRRRRPRLEDVSPDGPGAHQAACRLVDDIQLEVVPND